VASDLWRPHPFFGVMVLKAGLRVAVDVVVVVAFVVVVELSTSSDVMTVVCKQSSNKFFCNHKSIWTDSAIFIIGCPRIQNVKELFRKINKTRKQGSGDFSQHQIPLKRIFQKLQGHIQLLVHLELYNILRVSVFSFLTIP
jgi:hypothetical protein